MQSSYDAGHEAGVASIMDSPLWNNEDGVSQADVDAAIKAVNATLPGIIADATQEGIDLAKAKMNEILETEGLSALRTKHTQHLSLIHI